MTARASVLGVSISAVERPQAADLILGAAQDRVPLGVSALAVHGVMEGVADPVHQFRLNDLELVVPDGQPVRWALRWLHGIELSDRVCGPDLMADVCRLAAERGLSIFLYGSTPEVLERMVTHLSEEYPGLVVAGTRPSRFRPATDAEREADIAEIRASGASITFVGLGCPRQEIWAWETRNELQMPVLAVGAAFDYFAGDLTRAPQWMQDRGLEWLYRLRQEPRRLWRRYVILNPQYLWLVGRQRLGDQRLAGRSPVPPTGLERPG